MTEEVPVLTDAPAVARPPQRRPHRVPLLIAAVIGLVVGAAGVGVPWLLTSRGSGAVSGLPLTAPDTLGGIDKADVSPLKAKNDDTHRRLAQHNATSDRENSSRLSVAYNAPALMQTYTATDFSHAFQITAVRAHSPGLVTPYEDKDSGLAGPLNEIRHIGDVSCILRNNLAPSAQLTPDKTSVVLCQRTDATMTIQLKPLGDATRENTDPHYCADIINEAWAKLH